MEKLTFEQRKKIGAAHTTQEIYQQPSLWAATYQQYAKHRKTYQQFFEKIKRETTHQSIAVIFTGAGTSQYVGDTLVPYLTKHNADTNVTFQSVGTTELVAAPKSYLAADTPTLLVSFARSGNSPESIAAKTIAAKVVKQLVHLTITCAPEGKLAQMAKSDANQLVVFPPAAANDQAFAMTSSFTCMLLLGLLLFDRTSEKQKQAYVTEAQALGEYILANKKQLAQIGGQAFERIVYLGSGSLAGLAREAQLKVLELTAGSVATLFDSSLGFRHGPKSFINEKTLVIGFVSNDSYTQKYDEDVLNEVARDAIAKATIGISQKPLPAFAGTALLLPTKEIQLPDGYLALPYIMIAQLIALNSSLAVGNTPDTPSVSGTVHRVVQGVTIYPYD